MGIYEGEFINLLGGLSGGVSGSLLDNPANLTTVARLQLSNRGGVYGLCFGGCGLGLGVWGLGAGWT